MNSISKNNPSQYTIAFYNLENLFDTKDDRKTLDDDYTKNSQKGWNEKRFRNKIKKLGKVISNIGYSTTNHPPVIIGVAEVENLFVLKELVGSNFLKSKNYNIIHFDSPDERGIDTALLYRKDYFSIITSKVHTLYLENEFGQRDYTRDILHVHGKLEENPIHLLINHWPSRRAGPEISNPKRLAAAKKNREIISQIFIEDPSAKIMVMGDFNDDPTSDSVVHLKGNDFYNPMEQLHTLYSGSSSHRGSWNLFDQILISTNFFEAIGNPLRYEEAKIFNPIELQEYKGRNKGNPFRTFIGRKYLGGISDHFPVYTILSIKD